jgi:two-component sensor histidine kinase
LRRRTTCESWTGAALAEIIADTIRSHSGGKNRFRFEGPRVHLAPGPAVAFAMALHELSTNPHGALSSEEGRVDIAWRTEGNGEGRRLRFRWSEREGPPVVEPNRRGFGSRLVEKALAQELGGEVRSLYEASGVVCTIDAPLPEGQEVAGQPGDRPDG